MALWFSVGSQGRYLSHRDTIRLFCRALARASLPVKYSAGFNPHMRLSLPLPRPVGMGSLCELILIDLDEFFEPTDFMQILRKQMPLDLHIFRAGLAGSGPSPRPESMTYEMTLADSMDSGVLGGRIDQFIQSSDWLIHRPFRKRHPARTLDLREGILSLSLQGRSVSCTVRILPDGSPSLREIRVLLGLEDPASCTGVVRTHTSYAPPWGATEEFCKITGSTLRSCTAPPNEKQTNKNSKFRSD